jgi:L-asparaginase II
MQSCGGRVFVKVGAEGVFACGRPDVGLGLALKVEDGAGRAAGPALLAALAALGWLTTAEMGALSMHAAPPILNTRGEVVGELAARGRLG